MVIENLILLALQFHKISKYNKQFSSFQSVKYQSNNDKAQYWHYMQNNNDRKYSEHL